MIYISPPECSKFSDTFNFNQFKRTKRRMDELIHHCVKNYYPETPNPFTTAFKVPSKDTKVTSLLSNAKTLHNT
jgi:hypothetical protein